MKDYDVKTILAVQNIYGDMLADMLRKFLPDITKIAIETDALDQNQIYHLPGGVYFLIIYEAQSPNYGTKVEVFNIVVRETEFVIGYNFMISVSFNEEGLPRKMIHTVNDFVKRHNFNVVKDVSKDYVEFTKDIGKAVEDVNKKEPELLVSELL